MRNPFDLFGAAWNTVTSRPMIFVYVSLITAAVITLSAAVLGVDPAGPEPETLPTTSEFAFILISAVVGILANIAVMKAVADSTADLQGLTRFSVDKFLSYLWVAILTGVTVVVGFILLVIPGIFLAVALSFGSYVLIFEDVRGADALKRSYGYVKGRWFGVFGRYLFLMLVGILFTIALSFATVPTLLSPYLASFVIGFLSMLGTAISTAYIYSLYTDIRPAAAPAPTVPGEETGAPQG